MTTEARRSEEPTLVAKREQLVGELQSVDRRLTELRRAHWTASATRDGTWVVAHVDGRRRFSELSEGEAVAIAAALNGLRRIRVTGAVLLGGRPVGAGAECDLPAAEARSLVSQKHATFVD